MQELIQAHGGRIEAASAGKGQGSTFTVTLPLAATGGGDQQTDPAAAPGRPSSHVS